MPTHANSRSPFDFAQGRISTPLRSGRNDEFTSITSERKLVGREKKLVGYAYVGDVDAEGGGEGDLVVLLLEENLADLLGGGELA